MKYKRLVITQDSLVNFSRITSECVILLDLPCVSPLSLSAKLKASLPCLPIHNIYVSFFLQHCSVLCVLSMLGYITAVLFSVAGGLYCHMLVHVVFLVP